MAKTLKNLIESYQKGELSTPNIQVTDMVLSDETIVFAENIGDNLGDVSFSNCMVKNSSLTSIKICNGNFELGFFTESTFKNCTFERTNFQELECKKCVFNNCSFMNCRFVDSEISETVFSKCKFEKGSLESSEFYSCGFINPIFSDVLLPFAIISDSKFAKFNKSIKFEGKFFLSDILYPENGIIGTFREDWY